MKSFFLPVFISLFTLLNASSVIGLVQKVDGSVKVTHQGSFKKSNVEAGLEISVGDMFTTSKKATAVLKLVDDSILALDASSTLNFTTDKNAEQTSGKIFYKITSRNAKNSLKIKTPFAIIGIKGTTFVINASDNSSIALKEGVIGVKSIKEEFELYRKDVQQQFNNFIQEQNSAFEEFKQVQNPGFAEITKEFDLQAGNRISFDGNKVNEKDLNKDDDKEFRYFEKLIKSVK